MDRSLLNIQSFLSPTPLHYYKGEPKTRYVQFIETAAKDVISGIAQGTVDAGEIPGSANDFSAIRGYNTDGLLQGDIISVSSVDYLGYGYIELSPRADFHEWHHYPKVDNAEIARVKKAMKATGVKIETFNADAMFEEGGEAEEEAEGEEAQG